MDPNGYQMDPNGFNWTHLDPIELSNWIQLDPNGLNFRSVIPLPPSGTLHSLRAYGQACLTGLTGCSDGQLTGFYGQLTETHGHLTGRLGDHTGYGLTGAHTDAPFRDNKLAVIPSPLDVIIALR